MDLVCCVGHRSSAMWVTYCRSEYPKTQNTTALPSAAESPSWKMQCILWKWICLLLLTRPIVSHSQLSWFAGDGEGSQDAEISKLKPESIGRLFYPLKQTKANWVTLFDLAPNINLGCLKKYILFDFCNANICGYVTGPSNSVPLKILKLHKWYVLVSDHYNPASPLMQAWQDTMCYWLPDMEGLDFWHPWPHPPMFEELPHPIPIRTTTALFLNFQLWETS